MKKKIWRKNFEIKRTHFQMGSPALYDMVNLQYITVGRQIIKEAIWVQEGYDNTGTYFDRDKLRELIDETVRAVLNKPHKIDAIHKKCEKYNGDFFEYAKGLSKVDFKKLNNKEIATIWKKWVKLLIFSHGYALPTTWFIDSDGEDFSKLLIKKCDRIIRDKKSKLKSADIFSILTTPLKASFAHKEELEFFNILKEIKENKKAQRIFLEKDLRKIKENFQKIDLKLKNKILRHYNKWKWTPYTYIGPAYDLDYYLDMWSGILRQGIDFNKKINELKEQYKNAKKDKDKIIKQLEINKADKHLFDIASDIIYLKAYRKDCWFHGCYVAENIYKEIGRRLGLSLNQVWLMGWWEIAPALEKGEFDVNILNKRMKLGILRQRGEKGEIYVGEKANKFLDSLNIEKIKIKNLKHLKGTCAYAGKAKGRVKIINLPEEMGKMEQGDIMVAHTTFPSLVPAMKKAAAIITDDGGITCHAAIVARELKIICVVGTKIAAQVLKDGDLVEVDAERGSVKILKNEKRV